jgi:hypothetical protein
MHHHRLLHWSHHLAVPLFFVLCGCTPFALYENSSHSNYGAAEFKADLAQCRNQNVTVVVSVQGYNVHSWTRVDEMKANTCMAAHGWQQAPPSVS